MNFIILQSANVYHEPNGRRAILVSSTLKVPASAQLVLLTLTVPKATKRHLEYALFHAAGKFFEEKMVEGYKSGDVY